MTSDNENVYLPWDRFHNWVHCVCVVTFDIELGQAIELIYPPHAMLTEKEKLNICYLSFPDSNSACTGDTKYQCRIRRCHPTISSSPSILPFLRDAPTALQLDQHHYHGYVFFRQMKDHKVKRGYFQKSFILLSLLPLTNLFNIILDLLAPHLFDFGMPSLEAACHNIDQWPPPKPGHFLNLPITGSIIQIRIPSRADKLLNVNHQCRVEAQTNQIANIYLPSVYEVDIYSSLLPALSHIQVLWELVLICEPIVVFSSQPSVCSSVVQALTQMILPLRYSSDYHPFFTIHDAEFKEYTTKNDQLPGVILGVTNLFFVKALQHWPHVVKVNHEASRMTRSMGPLRRVGSHKSFDSYPGLYSKYEACLKRDKAFMRRVVKGMDGKRPPEVQNAMVKRHLLELTQSFIMPLERYIATLMPLARSINTHHNTPTLPPFDPEAFIKSLPSHGPQLTSPLKGNWVTLYRRFMKSPNFHHWWMLRKSEMTKKINLLHIQAISAHDFDAWMVGKSEVHLVDMIIRVKEKMRWLEKQQHSSSFLLSSSPPPQPPSSSPPPQPSSSSSSSSSSSPPSTSQSTLPSPSSQPSLSPSSSSSSIKPLTPPSSLKSKPPSKPSPPLSPSSHLLTTPSSSSLTTPSSSSSSLTISSSSSSSSSSFTTFDHHHLFTKLSSCLQVLISRLPHDLQPVFNKNP